MVQPESLHLARPPPEVPTHLKLFLSTTIEVTLGSGSPEFAVLKIFHSEPLNSEKDDPRKEAIALVEGLTYEHLFQKAFRKLKLLYIAKEDNEKLAKLIEKYP